MEVIGTRTIHYVDQKGLSRPVTVTITLDDPRIIPANGEDEDFNIQPSSYIVQSDIYSHSQQFIAVDRLNAIHTSMWLADISIQAAFRELGFALYTIVPDQPCEKPYDIWK